MRLNNKIRIMILTLIDTLMILSFVLGASAKDLTDFRLMLILIGIPLIWGSLRIYANS